MLIIVITILLTIVLMQNTDPVRFTILFSDVRMSKLTAMAATAVVGFILGYMVGRPKKARHIAPEYHEGDHDENDPNTLSEEDRKYISND
jgi:membrane protein YqaA with SNARE-associated domain